MTDPRKAALDALDRVRRLSVKHVTVHDIEKTFEDYVIIEKALTSPAPMPKEVEAAYERGRASVWKDLEDDAVRSKELNDEMNAIFAMSEEQLRALEINRGKCPDCAAVKTKCSIDKAMAYFNQRQAEIASSAMGVENERLRATIEKCAEQFRIYQHQHQTKANSIKITRVETELYASKAETNKRYADMCDKALTQPGEKS